VRVGTQLATPNWSEQESLEMPLRVRLWDRNLSGSLPCGSYAAPERLPIRIIYQPRHRVRHWPHPPLAIWFLKR